MNGCAVRWAGRAPRLWRSVITELQDAERRTIDNDVLTCSSVSTTAAGPRSWTPLGGSHS